MGEVDRPTVIPAPRPSSTKDGDRAPSETGHEGREYPLPAHPRNLAHTGGADAAGGYRLDLAMPGHFL